MYAFEQLFWSKNMKKICGHYQTPLLFFIMCTCDLLVNDFTPLQVEVPDQANGYSERSDYGVRSLYLVLTVDFWPARESRLSKLTYMYCQCVILYRLRTRTTTTVQKKIVHFHTFPICTSRRFSHFSNTLAKLTNSNDYQIRCREVYLLSVKKLVLAWSDMYTEGSQLLHMGSTYIIHDHLRTLQTHFDKCGAVQKAFHMDVDSTKDDRF